MFDRIVVVDWSANNTPKVGADSIWVAHLDRGGTAIAVNHRTRHRAFEAVLALAAVPGRVLLGFDFPLGHPAGFAARLGLAGEPWAATWAMLADLITDDARNCNNRFEVAAEMNRRLGNLQFWAAPPRLAGAHLTTTRPARGADDLPEFRTVERHLRDQGRYPFSVWHLLGAGSVGSQSLTGIPVVERLRHHPSIRDRVRIWPFETGLRLPTGHDRIVVAEVWPSAIRFDHVQHPVKDARQVIALAQWLAEQPADVFAPPVANSPTVLAEAIVHEAIVREAIVREEGWILGVT